jgi:hypothetical protein
MGDKCSVHRGDEKWVNYFGWNIPQGKPIDNRTILKLMFGK